jgi:3-hydroxybutyryl-CoA dehydrogenase
MNVFEKLKFKNNIYTNSSSVIFDKISFKVGILHFLNPISLKTVEVFSENNNIKLNEYLEKIKSIGFNIFFLESANDHFINKVLFLEISSFFYLLEVIKIKYSILKDIRSQFIASNDLIKTINLIGVDVCYNIFCNFSKEHDKFRIPKTIIEALERKILGKKNKTSIEILDIFKL